MSKLGVELFDKSAVFRVWAPFARQVAVMGEFSKWQAIPMAKDDQTGVWSVRVDGVRAGHSYKYQLEGYDGVVYYRNDPRAKALTDSDDGLGLVTNGKFDWEGYDKFAMPPLGQQVLYEIHIGTFARPDPSTTGTFTTAISKLDYLKELGVTTLELMPITAMAGAMRRVRFTR